MKWTSLASILLCCTLLVACGGEYEEADQMALQKQVNKTLNKKITELQKLLVELYKRTDKKTNEKTAQLKQQLQQEFQQTINKLPKDDGASSANATKIAELQKKLAELFRNIDAKINEKTAQLKQQLQQEFQQTINKLPKDDKTNAAKDVKTIESQKQLAELYKNIDTKINKKVAQLKQGFQQEFQQTIDKLPKDDKASSPNAAKIAELQKQLAEISKNTDTKINEKTTQLKQQLQQEFQQTIDKLPKDDKASSPNAAKIAELQKQLTEISKNTDTKINEKTTQLKQQLQQEFQQTINKLPKDDKASSPNAAKIAELQKQLTEISKRTDTKINEKTTQLKKEFQQELQQTINKLPKDDKANSANAAKIAELQKQLAEISKNTDTKINEKTAQLKQQLQQELQQTIDKLPKDDKASSANVTKIAELQKQLTEISKRTDAKINEKTAQLKQQLQQELQQTIDKLPKDDKASSANAAKIAELHKQLAGISKNTDTKINEKTTQLKQQLQQEFQQKINKLPKDDGVSSSNATKIAELQKRINKLSKFRKRPMKIVSASCYCYQDVHKKGGMQVLITKSGTSKENAIKEIRKTCKLLLGKNASNSCDEKKEKKKKKTK